MMDCKCVWIVIIVKPGLSTITQEALSMARPVSNIMLFVCDSETPSLLHIYIIYIHHIYPSIHVWMDGWMDG